MKNIHVVLAEKSGRVGIFVDTQELTLRSEKDIPRGENVNILITNDEEIKEGDWIYDISSLDYNPLIHKATNIDAIHLSTKDSLHTRGLICTARNLKGRYKKIILTTDQDLIKDGVQAIDDEFLEWFINNPSCEKVEVKEITTIPSLQLGSPNGHLMYKIIIPQEEPKKMVGERIMPLDNDNIEEEEETLEEIAENELRKQDWDTTITLPFNGGYIEGFQQGAKWQQEQERMYSEEEVINALHSVELKDNKNYSKIYEGMKEWFEKNKKQ